MSRRSPCLSLLLLLVLVGQVTSSGFRICAYNLKAFDKVKASNYRAMYTLKRVRRTSRGDSEGLEQTYLCVCVCV